MPDKKEWSPEDVKALRATYSVTPDKALARTFRCSIDEIAATAKRLALAKDKRAFPGETKMPRWTDEEERLMRGLYPTTPSVEIARKLGRSLKSVNGKALKMGLAKTDGRIAEMGAQNAQRGRKARRSPARGAKRAATPTARGKPGKRRRALVGA